MARPSSPDGGAMVAEWDVASLKPKDSKQFSITLSAPAAPGKSTKHDGA